MSEPEDRREEDLRDLTEDIGLDPSDLASGEHTADTGESKRSVDIDFSTKTVVRFEPVAPESPEVGDYTDVQVMGDSQLEVVVKKRPKCPTCGYILTAEDDPLHLPGKCWKCSIHVCPQCRVECRTCDRIMCPNHSSGVGVEDEARCSEHAQDRLQEIRHERVLDLRQQEWEDARLRLDHERQRHEHVWKRVKQREELEIKRQQQRFENKLEAERHKLEGWKLKTLIKAQDAVQTREVLRSNLKPKHAIEIQEQAPNSGSNQSHP